MAREEEWSVQLLDWDDRFVRDLTEFTGGSIEFNSASTIHGSGTLDVMFDGDGARSVRWASARVKVWYSPNVGVPATALGVFLVSTPTWSYNDDLSISSASINLMDKLTVLNQDTAGGCYSAPAGTVVTTLVQAIIEGAGETAISVVASMKALAAGLVWPADATKLQIINDLLDTINYRHVWCDRNGYYRIEPYVPPLDRPVTFTFDQITPRYLPAWQRDNDWYDVPNRAVLVTQGSDTAEALISVATDLDPESPYSYVSRGDRWITLTETGVEAADQATLDALAARRLVAAQYRASNLNVTHVMEPDVWLDDRVAFNNELTRSTAVVHKWSVTLTPGSLVQATWLEVTQVLPAIQVRMTPVKVSRMIKWTTESLYHPVAATRAVSWKVRQQVQVLRLISWGVASFTGVAAAFRVLVWSVRKQIPAARAVVWNVKDTNPVGTSRAVGWNVKEQISTSRTVSWNVQSGPFTEAWPSVAYPGATFPGYAPTPYSVAASRGTSWTTRAYTAPTTRDISWNVFTSLNVLVTRDVKWTALWPLRTDRVLRWNVLAPNWTTSVFDGIVPTGLQQSSSTPYNLGTVIRVNEAGSISAIRFYVTTPHDTFTSTVRLYIDGDTTAVRETTYQWTSGTPAGWVEVPIAPYSAAANQVVMAAYTIPGYYLAELQGLAPDITSADGRLTAPTSVMFNGVPGNGRYSENLALIPDQEWMESNYFVDLVLGGPQEATAVGTSRGTTWNVIEWPKATRDILWAVGGKVPVARDLLWNVEAAISEGWVSSLYGSSTPAGTKIDDPNVYNLGTVIQCNVPGSVTKIRFYMIPPHDTFTTTVRLYVDGNTTAVRSATHEWASGTAEGWVEVAITPYDVTLDQVVMAAYTINGYYIAQPSGLTSDIDSSDARLTAPSSVTFNGTSGNGKFNTSMDVLPDSTYQSGNYFVDLTLEGAGGASAVGASRGISWTTRQEMPTTRDVSWTTTEKIDTTRDLLWNVLTDSWTTSLYGTSTPGGSRIPDTSPYNMGTVIKCNSAGDVTAIKFYVIPPHDTWVTTVRLYIDGTTVPVRSATYEWTTGTPEGWVTVPITPYTVTQDQLVMAAYTTPGYYVALNNGFSGDISSADNRLTAQSSPTFNGVGGNSRYATSVNEIPDSTYQATNYFTDLVLEG